MNQQDTKLNQHIAGEIEQTHAAQTKHLLQTTKGELEKAANTIRELNNEIKIQQEYYEMELQKQRTQINNILDPQGNVSTKATSDRENYELAIKNCLMLREKVNSNEVDKQELLKQIGILNQELKLQE